MAFSSFFLLSRNIYNYANRLWGAFPAVFVSQRAKNIKCIISFLFISHWYTKYQPLEPQLIFQDLSCLVVLVSSTYFTDDVACILDYYITFPFSLHIHIYIVHTFKDHSTGWPYLSGLLVFLLDLRNFGSLLSSLPLLCWLLWSLSWLLFSSLPSWYVFVVSSVITAVWLLYCIC